MSMIKIVLASAAALGMVAAGTASAEPTRSSAAIPSVGGVKKLKLSRTVAPAARESKEVEAADIGLGLLAGGLAGLGLYEATKGNSDSSGS